MNNSIYNDIYGNLYNFLHEVKIPTFDQIRGMGPAKCIILENESVKKEFIEDILFLKYVIEYIDDNIENESEVEERENEEVKTTHTIKRNRNSTGKRNIRRIRNNKSFKGGYIFNYETIVRTYKLNKNKNELILSNWTVGIIKQQLNLINRINHKYNYLSETFKGLIKNGYVMLNMDNCYIQNLYSLLIFLSQKYKLNMNSEFSICIKDIELCNYLLKYGLFHIMYLDKEVAIIKRNGQIPLEPDDKIGSVCSNLPSFIFMTSEFIINDCYGFEINNIINSTADDSGNQGMYQALFKKFNIDITELKQCKIEDLNNIGIRIWTTTRGHLFYTYIDENIIYLFDDVQSWNKKQKNVDFKNPYCNDGVFYSSVLLPTLSFNNFNEFLSNTYGNTDILYSNYINPIQQKGGIKNKTMMVMMFIFILMVVVIVVCALVCKKIIKLDSLKI